MSYRPVSGTTLVTAYPPALAHRNGLEVAPFRLPKAVRPGGPRSKVVEYPNSRLGTGRIGGPLSLAGEEGKSASTPGRSARVQISHRSGGGSAIGELVRVAGFYASPNRRQRFDYLGEAFGFGELATGAAARPNMIPVSTSTGCPSFR
jgi:hypothetical protein